MWFLIGEINIPPKFVYSIQCADGSIFLILWFFFIFSAFFSSIKSISRSLAHNSIQSMEKHLASIIIIINAHPSKQFNHSIAENEKNIIRSFVNASEKNNTRVQPHTYMCDLHSYSCRMVLLVCEFCCTSCLAFCSVVIWSFCTQQVHVHLYI